MWTPVLVDARQMGKQRYGLDGFAETHFIGENAIQPAIVHRHEPVETDVLVFAQTVFEQEWNGSDNVGGR